MKQVSLCLLALAASSFLYSSYLSAFSEKQIQRRLYVRSSMQVFQANSRRWEATGWFGLSAATATAGFILLWQQTRQQKASTSELEEALQSLEESIEFPQAIATLSEVETDILTYCQRLNNRHNIPASTLQQSKYGAIKELKADAIREVFQSLEAKGYGICEGEGRKLTFTPIEQA